MTMLAIDTIHESTDNARRIASDKLSDQALRMSIQQLGMLQPILVQPNGDGYTVVAGHRRLAAARALGWEEVPAVTLLTTKDNVHTVAMSAAENMVRAPMHPVDTWRAIATLKEDHDYSLQGAADALGVPMTLARRLYHLASMAPEVIDALAAESELPQASTLRTISMAPQDVQLKALTQARKKDHVDWWSVAQRCETTRIPASRAIFPIHQSECSVRFDEDLFAQADDIDRFSTTDVAGFLKAQRAALDAQARASKGRMTAMPWSRTQRLCDHLPKGWQATYDVRRVRWAKDDPRHVFATVIEEGFELGKVEYIVATPKKDRPTAVPSDIETEAVHERSPITKATYDRLAIMKRQEVVSRLTRVAASENAADMLRALLLCLSFENVALWDADRRYGAGPYRDLARKLVNDDGSPRYVTEAEACWLAAATIARVVKFEGGDATNTSGKQAEWLAAMIGAEMPRCDTADILKGVSKDKLIELARLYGIDETGKTSDIRARLVGNMPEWRPVDFGAAGPSGYHFQPEAEDEDASGSEMAEEAAS